MTELGFLIDLMLNHKLPLATRKSIAERIKDVESTLSGGHRGNMAPAQGILQPRIRSATDQAPSTAAAIAKHNGVVVERVEQHAPEPVAVIAQTPMAMAAMESRQRAISESIAGKTDKTTGRPRKW